MPKTKPVADDLQSTILRSTDNDDDVKRIKHIAKYRKNSCISRTRV